MTQIGKAIADSVDVLGADDTTIPTSKAVRDVMAPLASPALTGNPTAPTPAVDDNDTSIATTAFIQGQKGTAAPAMDGTAAAGSSTKWTPIDHVHPTDTSRASISTTTTTIYVNKDVVGGNNDGTSWANAFTTIQAALTSLPTIINNTIVINVRKATTAYAETLTINSIIGNGSLSIYGEFSWNGNCAAASTPSTTKFNTAAHTDGSNIAAGDYILVTSGYGSTGSYKYFVATTVKAVVSKGSNIYEVELNAAADWGNIGSTDFYVIVKTSISGTMTITNNTIFTLFGIAMITSTNCFSISYGGILNLNSVYASSSSGSAIGTTNGGTFTSRSCYLYGGSYAINFGSNAVCYIGTYSGTAGQYCVVVSSGSARTISSSQGVITVESAILHIGVNSAYGLYGANETLFTFYRGTIVITSGITGTTGIYCTGASFAKLISVTNTQAATPKNPASATDPSFIG